MSDETANEEDGTGSEFGELDEVLDDNSSSEADHDAWSDLDDVGIKQSPGDGMSGPEDEDICDELGTGAGDSGYGDVEGSELPHTTRGEWCAATR